jgi:pyruvate/2-oxoglutarate dehydrogenase complex dihydrolipoamide acyltransferase (E2) component
MGQPGYNDSADSAGVLFQVVNMRQDAFSRSIELTVPELGAQGDPIQMVNWLVPVGARVISGERIVELLTQGTLLQLEASVDGVLAEQSARPGTFVQTHDVIGRIVVSESADS